ncbi:hypothetical protein J1605_001937 [Eschrichtius robustus]|uniref:Uncharacterized protein n=1 Tax=Eschrichtius robustus TaxID=9764 RepID=A0AB34HYG9_ESCRO|nr:hypothetical protein J1605_001937 [Eschrichtius robustus]
MQRSHKHRETIVYMGWCETREQDPLQDRVYSPTFLALRGSCLYKFLAPPLPVCTIAYNKEKSRGHLSKTNDVLVSHLFKVTTWDWTRAEKTFSVYEIMCKVLKVGPASSDDHNGFSSARRGSGLIGSS